MAKGIAPMVEKVSDLLPLYLAISQQTEGSRRLLIMVCLKLCAGAIRC